MNDVVFLFPQIFDAEQEAVLMQYLLKSSAMFYGLSTRDVRNLAFGVAQKLNIPMPKNWLDYQMAGVDWFLNFMKRHRELSLRKPQATSLSRATSFNRHNVGMFYRNLAAVRDELKVQPQHIWNMDESGVTTVQKPECVVAQRGARQVGKLTSAERGTLITIALAVSATGASIPPFFVFPRVRFHPRLLNNSPPGSVGIAHPSGWMNADGFLLFLEHFQSSVGSSKDQPRLLLLDNHGSHLSAKALDFCVDHGIHVVSFPPHCTHKLQPLDRSVFGPLKAAISRSCDGWMRDNPGRTITINELAGLVKDPFKTAVTPSNIQAGFECTGIYPYNEDKFTDLDFMPAAVTDRPNPIAEEMVHEDIDVAAYVEIDNAIAEAEAHDHPNLARIEIENEAEPESTTASVSGSSVSELSSVVASVMPFPVAPPRKETTRGRKRRKTAILTSKETLEMLRAEELAAATKKAEAKKRAEARAAGRGRGRGGAGCSTGSLPTPSGLGQPKKKPPLMLDTSDSSSEEDEVHCCECAEPLTYSETNRTCIICHLSAHIRCGRSGPMYTCTQCSIEDEFADMESDE